MGTTQPTCDFCGETETENNPIMIVFSRGKRHNQAICWDCIKNKVLRQHSKRYIVRLDYE